MTEVTKVFCTDCFHFRRARLLADGVNEVVNGCWASHGDVLIPEVMNKNNDCKMFEAKPLPEPKKPWWKFW
jgi:hypothetical protein